LEARYVFWALEAAAFVAVAAFWRDKVTDARLLGVAFAGIGLVTAFVGWLSARGSKFWQQNWEKHIDLLEDQFEAHLHKTIWIGSGGVQFSVSRLNEKLNLIFFLFWMSLFVAIIAYVDLSAYGFKFILQPPRYLVVILASLMFFAATGSLFFLYCTKTNLKDEHYDFIRRRGPGEAL
jgi:hypothetical protein